MFGFYNLTWLFLVFDLESLRKSLNKNKEGAVAPFLTYQFIHLVVSNVASESIDSVTHVCMVPVV
jgi:hypothetical protein